MKKLLIICQLWMCTGCVAWISDTQLNLVKPEIRVLQEISGVYEEKAAYNTPANWMGLIGDTQFSSQVQAYIPQSSSKYRDANTFQIRTIDDAAIQISWHLNQSSDLPVKFISGVDFQLRNSKIVFMSKGLGSNFDSPGFALGSRHIEIMLNQNKDLLVISKGWGVGLFTVVPFVMNGTTISIYSRVKA